MLNIRLYRTFMICALVVVTIYYTQMVTMPIILSGLCAMLVHPLVKRLENVGIGLTFASMIVVVGVSTLFFSILGLLAYQGSSIISDLPIEKVEPMIKDPVTTIDKHIQLDLGEYQDQVNMVVAKGKKNGTKLAVLAITSINNTITYMLSCPVFIFFMLISRKQIRKFYYLSFKPKNRGIANRILCQIEMVYMKYIRGLCYVMLTVALLTGVGLYALGIEYAFFLGILAGILTLIPYVGVFVSAMIPVIVALLTKDSAWYALAVVGVFVVVQFLEGNIITPQIMGKEVGINPLIVVLSIIIFGAIGGVVGMILTIPILAMLKTIAFYVPGWKPFRQLLKA